MKILKTSGHVEELRGVRNMHLHDMLTHHSNSLPSQRVCSQVSLRVAIFTPLNAVSEIDFQGNALTGDIIAP
jgi:hypothetical protein